MADPTNEIEKPGPDPTASESSGTGDQAGGAVESGDSVLTNTDPAAVEQPKPVPAEPNTVTCPNCGAAVPASPSAGTASSSDVVPRPTLAERRLAEQGDTAGADQSQGVAGAAATPAQVPSPVVDASATSVPPHPPAPGEDESVATEPSDPPAPANEIAESVQSGESTSAPVEQTVGYAAPAETAASEQDAAKEGSPAGDTGENVAPSEGEPQS